MDQKGCNFAFALKKKIIFKLIKIPFQSFEITLNLLYADITGTTQT